MFDHAENLEARTGKVVELDFGGGIVTLDSEDIRAVADMGRVSLDAWLHDWLNGGNPDSRGRIHKRGLVEGAYKGCEFRFLLLNHAVRRMQQRGKRSNDVVTFAYYSTRSKWVGGGVMALSLTKEDIKEMQKDKVEPGLIERIRNLVLLVKEGSSIVVTILHMDGRAGRIYRGGATTPGLEQRRQHEQVRPHWSDFLYEDPSIYEMQATGRRAA